MIWRSFFVIRHRNASTQTFERYRAIVKVTIPAMVDFDSVNHERRLYAMYLPCSEETKIETRRHLAMVFQVHCQARHSRRRYGRARKGLWPEQQGHRTLRSSQHPIATFLQLHIPKAPLRIHRRTQRIQSVYVRHILMARLSPEVLSSCLGMLMNVVKLSSASRQRRLWCAVDTVTSKDRYMLRRVGESIVIAYRVLVVVAPDCGCFISSCQRESVTGSATIVCTAQRQHCGR